MTRALCCIGAAAAGLLADIFLVTIPGWAELILLCAAGVSAGQLWRRHSQKRFRILSGAGIGAAAAIILYSCFFSPYWNSVTFRAGIPPVRAPEAELSSEEVREDIASAYRAL